MKLLAATVLLLSAPLCVWAQQPKPVPKIERVPERHIITRKPVKPWFPVPGKVYTYVEQMPELPSGSGTWRVVAEVMKRMKIPAGTVEPSCYRVFASFEVSATGVVQHARIKEPGSSAVIDSAVLRAVRSLPRFKPGRQAGQAVAVRFTLPMRIATQ